MTEQTKMEELWNKYSEGFLDSYGRTWLCLTKDNFIKAITEATQSQAAEIEALKAELSKEITRQQYSIVLAIDEPFEFWDCKIIDLSFCDNLVRLESPSLRAKIKTLADELDRIKEGVKLIAADSYDEMLLCVPDVESRGGKVTNSDIHFEGSYEDDARYTYPARGAVLRAFANKLIEGKERLARACGHTSEGDSQ